MRFQDLRREYDQDQIGPLIWELLLDVSALIARSGYPPEAYGESAWSDDAVAELAQDVATERLIQEAQIDYVMAQATDVVSFRRLLAFQVKRVLSRRRAVTVVDRLLDRVRQMDLAAAYRVIEVGSDKFIAPEEGGREPTSLPDAELRRGSRLIDPIPRLVSSPNARRESKVYDRDDLSEIVHVLVQGFDGILLRDLRRILEITLTAWLPTVLHDHEEDRVEHSTPELEMQRTEMRNLVHSFVTNLEEEHRVVLLGKAKGLADGVLAQRLGRSRPWVSERKREVFDEVEARVMTELPTELLLEAMRMLLDAATAEESSDG